MDERWSTSPWNYHAAIVAVAVAGCGPTIVLDSDTDASDSTVGPGDDGIPDGDDTTPTCTQDSDCGDGFRCDADGTCVEDPISDNYNDEYTDEYNDDFEGDYYDDDSYYDSEGCGTSCMPCLEPTDCQTTESCTANYCEPLPAVSSPCPFPPSLVALELAVPIPEGDDVIRLDFVDAGFGPGEDLVISRSTGAEVIPGSGTQPAVPLPIPKGTTLAGVVAGDFFADGGRDLVVSLDPAGLVMLQGVGDGTFLPAVSLDESALPGVMAGMQWNEDTFLDIAMGNEGGLTVHTGDGAGGFSANLTVTLDGPIPALAVRNIPAALDSVVVSDPVEITRYDLDDPGGVALPLLTPGADGTLRTLVSGDFTGSGTPAIAAVDPAGGTSVITVFPFGGTRVEFTVPGNATSAASGALSGDPDDLLLLVDGELAWVNSGAGGPSGLGVNSCTDRLLEGQTWSYMTAGALGGRAGTVVALANGGTVTLVVLP